MVQQAKKRILRYLGKRSVVTFAAAPGNGEVEPVLDESLGESDPVLALLFSTATVGVAPAGPAQRRVRLACGPQGRSQ